MKLWWHGLSTPSKIVAALFALLLLALFAAMFSVGAHADGYEGYSAKDAPRYRLSDSSYRPAAYTKKRGCSEWLTKRECARIAEQIERRQRAARYRDEPSPRYVERRRAPESLYVASGRRECKPSIRAEGRERGTLGRAEKSARNEWREAAKARHGYDFADLASARDADIRCRILRHNGFGVPIRTCTMRARPCEDR